MLTFVTLDTQFPLPEPETGASVRAPTAQGGYMM